MPKRIARPHGRGRSTPEGISERERAFAEERRRDPASANWIIAKRAGFLGDERVLGERARQIMKKAAVLAIIHAPEPLDPLDGDDGELSDAKLIIYLKRQLLSIVRGKTADKDKLSAIDKLISTVPGGYAPLQVDARGKITMEMLVRTMGGAPDDGRAPVPFLQREGDNDGAEPKAANA